MIKRCTLSILVILISLLSFAQQSKKVLFVGNSYTTVNDLALITSNIAASVGNELIYDSHSPGGQRFMDHASNLILAEKINSEDWDFVTLQGQSVEVALTGEIFDTEVVPFAAQLVNNIRFNNSCTQPVFFRTWGRENGFTSPACDPFPWMCTYEGMDDELAQNYQILAEQNKTLVSPVGAVWRYLRTYHPELDLYSDGSHPSEIGSYVAAVVFNTMFFNTDPTFITYNYVLSETDANNIKNAAHIVLYQHINDFDFTAFFNEVTTETSVSFIYDDLEADSFLWNFGDGNTSTLQQPIHSFDDLGDYEVSLTIQRCGRQHTYTKLVRLGPLSVTDDLFKSVSLYPNPSRDIIHITGSEGLHLNLEIYDSLGKPISAFQSISDTVSISKLQAGVYFLKIYNQQSTKVIKLIKY